MNIPSTLQSLQDRKLAYPCLPTPLGDGKSLSVMCKIVVVSLIICLIFPCYPLTVTGMIPFAVVQSLNLKVGTRPLAHVANEVFVAVPSFANSYSSTSIIGEFLHVWIQAPSSHREPNGILDIPNGRPAIRVSAMRDAILFSPASARLIAACLRVKQVRKLYFFFGTASASAKNVQVTAALGSFRDNGPSPNDIPYIGGGFHAKY